MLGLPDRFHGTVVLHRFRNRCRSRVTDDVVLETTRIAMNKRKVTRDSVRQKRGCAHRERGKGK